MKLFLSHTKLTAMAQACQKSPLTFIQCVGSAFFFLQIASTKADGKLCGDPPSFPHTILHGHTGFEMGDELHYVCAQGYVMSNKDTAFTLLCHTCGEWFGQVQACVKDETEGHIDYEDNFPDDRSMPIEEHNTKEMEHESDNAADDGNNTQFDGDNHIGLKTIYNDQDTKAINEGEDFPIGPILVNNDTKATKIIDSNTGQSWLDGYPVTQEAVEGGEEVDKTDGSMGMEEGIHTDQPNYVGVRKAGRSNLEKDFIQIEAVPSLVHDDGIKGIPVTLTPTSVPENVSVSSKGSDGFLKYSSATHMGFVSQELASAATITSLHLAIMETSTAFRLIDHIPMPEKEETTPVQAVTTIPSQVGFTEMSAEEFVERETLSYGLGGKFLTTFEPCIGIDCSIPHKGTKIAIGMTVVCLLLLASVLAVWCFKKRQLKTSVYKLNGKDHIRHQLQQIEMQKV